MSAGILRQGDFSVMKKNRNRQANWQMNQQRLKAVEQDTTEHHPDPQPLENEATCKPDRSRLPENTGRTARST
ncbi:exodeoxyribonuclease 8 [Salmonella enterica subsp. enterica serovar Typhimurium]|nr:exodeoxyribonuclease 8 [Salmonella enterica subsp. enterica serovar Typhimurium]